MAFFGHKLRGGVDIVQLHLARVSPEEQPLLTLRKGHGSKSAVLLRVSISPDGPEFRVNEFPIEAATIQAAVLREGGSIEQPSRYGRWGTALVPRLGTSMLIEQ